MSDADVVLHAGGWVEPPLLDALEARAKRVVACWGNNDGAELRRRLPERADATLGPEWSAAFFADRALKL